MIFRDIPGIEPGVCELHSLVYKGQLTMLQGEPCVHWEYTLVSSYIPVAVWDERVVPSTHGCPCPCHTSQFCRHMIYH